MDVERQNGHGVQVYSWGRGDLGQLGVGEIEGSSSFVWISSLAHKDVVHVSASEFHSAFVTDEGELYTTGSNDSGQLGVKVEDVQFTPVRVSALDTSVVSHVACGQGHTVAVTDTGSLVAWGSGEFGQLGLKDAAGVFNNPQPRFIRGSRELLFVRVACGTSHTLALTGSGDVYSFGEGTFGALGHGTTESCSTPALVDSLWGLGVVQIACGDNHSCALTVDGQLFSWGRGKYGQLGCETAENQTRPGPVTALGDQMTVQVACGANHTMTINSEGKLFTWGQGHWYQTGHGIPDNILVPKQVTALGDESVVQASGGARHTIVLTSAGNIYAWGENEQGQVSYGGSQIQPNPLLLSFLQISRKQVLYVVAGGEHTFAALATEDNEMPLDRLDKHGAGLRALKPPCLHILFADTRNKTAILHSVESVFSSVKFLTLSFKSRSTCWCGKTEDTSEFATEEPGLNVNFIRNVYQRILELYDPDIVQRLGASILRMLDSIEKHIDSVPDSRWLRVLLIVLQCPLIGEKGIGDTISMKLFSLFFQISPSAARYNNRNENREALHIVQEWLKTFPKDIFGGRFVRGVQKFISNRKESINGRGPIPFDIAAALKVLSLLHTVNEKEKLLHFSEFYNATVSQEADIEAEYLKWVRLEYKSEPLISYCQVPFILTPEVKSRILQVEANLQKQHVVQASMIEHFLGNASASPFLVLQVRRSSLVQDSLQQLSVHPYELKKPLMVIFEGESGVDQGGVTKEFFQLLVRDLFNVGYGMFTYSEESRNFWFNTNSMETELEFQLVGIILGLAIYNGVILDVHFPLVVYKKLLEIEPRLEDLRDLQPQLHKSLLSLLTMEEDVSSLELYFEVSYECFGETKSYELVPNGASTLVTNENRERYVNLYVKYLLETSVNVQFGAFKRGFLQVCGGPALRMFPYEELELLICGLRHYDFDALEKATTYQGGYSKDSQIIQWFWSLVKEMSLEEKKQFLFFTTGNDRAPVGGLGSLRLIIQRNGNDTERLPTAHTCFNILLLPEYSSKQKLEQRLKLAISNSTGFGLQ